MLVTRVAEDDDWEPRSRAIWIAALLGGHQPQILGWIRDLVVNEDDPMTRSAAAESWTLFWAAQPDERATWLGSWLKIPGDTRAAVARALGDDRPEILRFRRGYASRRRTPMRGWRKRRCGS